MRRLHMAFAQAEEGSQRTHQVCHLSYRVPRTHEYATQRRPTALSPLTSDSKTTDNPDGKNAAQDHSKAKLKLITSMSRTIERTFLDLLVTISGMLDADHYQRLGPVLWHACILNSQGTTSAAVSSLIRCSP